MNDTTDFIELGNKKLCRKREFSLKQQYIASLRQSFDGWFSQWFYTKIGAISEWPSQTQLYAQESILLRSEHSPLLEMRLSDATLVGMCGQKYAGASREATVLFAENALKDLLAKVSFCRDLETSPYRESQQQLLSASAVFTVATKEGVIEIIFYSELYACYLQSLMTNGNSCEVVSLLEARKLSTVS